MSAAAATQPDWNPIEHPIDYVMIGGVRTPGLAEVTGAGSPRQWDERAGYGLSGALVVFHGLKLSHFTITLRLYTLEHWTEWHKFKRFVAKPPLGTRQRALDVQHPLLDECGIASMVVEDVGQFVQTEDGVWDVAISCIEYRRPKAGLSKPDGSAATPEDPYDRQIDEQSRRIDDLIDQ